MTGLNKPVTSVFKSNVNRSGTAATGGMMGMITAKQGNRSNTAVGRGFIKSQQGIQAHLTRPTTTTAMSQNQVNYRNN